MVRVSGRLNCCHNRHGDLEPKLCPSFGDGVGFPSRCWTAFWIRFDSSCCYISRMSTPKRRHSYLRPLTQIAPQLGNDALRRTSTDPTGTAVKTSSFLHSTELESQARSRTNESNDKPALPRSRRASVSVASSRASSFADDDDHNYIPNPAAHSPSIPPPKAAPYTNTKEINHQNDENPKLVLSNAFQLLWESGVDKIMSDLWASVIDSWKAGDIASPPSTFFGLTLSCRAHQTVHRARLVG